MTINQSKTKDTNEASFSLQPYIWGFVVVMTALLVLMPLWPTLVSNLQYSFSGDAPKVYWYLSRATGFVALTILWVSMALGIGLSNKLARKWPGAPTAFAMHEFLSLLGLSFAIYHGLVLMGDHFVDFSLPRILTPFSIEHRTVWVGLGQVSFYAWVIAAASFYVRRWIGQKTWRLIHYTNFVTFALGWLHGTFSGSDSVTPQARWYYWITAEILLVLLAYRLYESTSKKNLSFRQLARNGFAYVSQILRTILGGPPRLNKVSAAEAPFPDAGHVSASLGTASASTPSPTTDERSMPSPKVENQEPKPSEEAANKAHAPLTADASSAALAAPEDKIGAHPLVEKYEIGSGENKINVRIFREPPEPDCPEPGKDAQVDHGDLNTEKLISGLKKDFLTTPSQPSVTANLRFRRIKFLDEE